MLDHYKLWKICIFSVERLSLAMKLQTFWHMDTVPTANHHYLIQSMAQLYRALRNAGLITTIWKDMETVIESQGASGLGLRDTDPGSFSFLSASLYA